MPLIPPSESTILSRVETYVVTSMCISKRFIVVGLDNRSVGIFDQEGTYGLRWKTEEHAVWSVDIWEEEVDSKDWLICGGGQGELRVWRLDNLHEISTLSGHVSTVRCVKAISSNRAISSSRDSTIRIWNIVTGECQGVLEGHTATVRALALYNNIVISASYDSTVRIWSLEKKECKHTLKGHEGQIYSAVCDGTRIVTAGLGGEVRIWGVQSGSCLAVLKVPTPVVSCLQLVSSILVTGDIEGTLYIWSMDNYSELRKICAHRNPIISMQICGSKIVSGGSDGTVKEWDLQSGELVRELADSDAVWHVGYARGSIVAALTRDGNVVLEIWEQGDGSKATTENSNPSLSEIGDRKILKP